MLKKINRDNLKFKILNLKFPIFTLLILLLIYTRFVNIGWGLPYPMHPDERNMAVAIQGLSSRDWFNPHFFAYGQFPLYLGYLLFFLFKISPILSLRIISAIASILTVYVLYKIISNFKFQISNQFLILLILIFSPYAIQFAHFGTTESLLMLFYSLIIYYSIKLLDSDLHQNYIFPLSFFSGLAIATKISAAIFITVPILVIISKFKIQRSKLSSNLKNLVFALGFALCTLIFALVLSPHNILNWQEFLGSMRYESDVALGNFVAFYTRQFVGAVPAWFQLSKVFPYAMGLLMSLMSLIGLMGIGWKDRRINLLRFAFFIYFLPTAFLFAKWTRFMAPLFPVLSIFALLFISKIKNQISKLQLKIKNFFIFICRFTFYILIFASIYPGIAYLRVYQNPDTRFQATDWINKNISPGSYILSETANVVDIPLQNQNNLNVISFNFYDLDQNPELQKELRYHLQKANYIFVPSRRIFANLNNNYPLLEKYYKELFNGKLSFKKVGEFSAGLNDENAEETWTVFDHPVIRIYQRVKSL